MPSADAALGRSRDGQSEPGTLIPGPGLRHPAHTNSRTETTASWLGRQTFRGRAPRRSRYSPPMRTGVERNRQVQIGAVLPPWSRQPTPAPTAHDRTASTTLTTGSTVAACISGSHVAGFARVFAASDSLVSIISARYESAPWPENPRLPKAPPDSDISGQTPTGLRIAGSALVDLGWLRLVFAGRGWRVWGHMRRRAGFA